MRTVHIHWIDAVVEGLGWDAIAEGRPVREVTVYQRILFCRLYKTRQLIREAILKNPENHALTKGMGSGIRA